MSLLKGLDHKGKAGFYATRLIQKSGLIHVKHVMEHNANCWKCGEGDCENFIEYYETHKRDFEFCYNLLEDDFSKETYKAVIAFHRTGNIRYINRVRIFPQYFLKDIFIENKYEIFLDGGAYIGDTALDFIKYYKKNNYKMYLWEPDEKNIEQIHRLLNRIESYEVLPFAMWSQKEILKFSANADNGKIDSNRGIDVLAESVDNLFSEQQVTFIKMDIEGAEIEALKGADRVIREQKPKLAISIYHKYSHLHEIIQIVKEMVPEYRIYVRHHSDLGNETVMYAIV